MATAIQVAKAKLREAVLRLARAERAGLGEKDPLAFRRLVISLGVRRAAVRKLEKAHNEGPQANLFSPNW